MGIKFFSTAFLRGTLALLPIILTIYPIFYFFRWLDLSINKLLQYFFTQLDYLPGLGTVVGFIIIFLLGLLMSTNFVQRLYKLIELPFKNIPLVKTLYSAIKELTRYLTPEEEGEKADKVVVIKHPETEMQIIGFVMQSDLSALPEELDKKDRVAVYIPMSYQVGGFTVFLPRSCLSKTSMSVETGMKEVMTGWMSSN